MRLVPLIDRLETKYGKPGPHPPQGPWEMIVWENIVYLAGDEDRLKAFKTLRREVGLSPEAIRRCARDKLVGVARCRGILAENCAEKLKDAAEVAVEKWGGDLGGILKLPPSKAVKALREFPGIGDPGAEKILLFTRTHPVLALESNGLRVLLRLGFGEEKGGYAATYRSAQAAAEEECPRDSSWRIRAHHLLRRHGRETCRRSDPECDSCPIARDCRFFLASRRRS